MRKLLIVMLFFIAKNGFAQNKIQFDSTLIHVGTISHYEANNDTIIFQFTNISKELLFFNDLSFIYYDSWNPNWRYNRKLKIVKPNQKMSLKAVLKMSDRIVINKSTYYSFYNKAGKEIEKVQLIVQGRVVENSIPINK